MASTIAALLLSASTQFALPQGLLQSVCYVESAYDTNAVHKDDGNGDSLGLCQVKYKTAQWLGYKGPEKGLMDPRVNSYYAAKYLHYQLIRYNDNIPRALTAYNRGNANRLTHSIYSDKVLNQWGYYQDEQRREERRFQAAFEFRFVDTGTYGH